MVRLLKKKFLKTKKKRTKGSVTSEKALENCEKIKKSGWGKNISYVLKGGNFFAMRALLH